MKPTKIRNNIGISQIKVNRTLRNAQGDISVSLSGDWLSDEQPLSCGKDVQIAYLHLSKEVDIAAIRSQWAKGVLSEQQAQMEINRLQQQYEKQIQEVSDE